MEILVYCGMRSRGYYWRSIGDLSLFCSNIADLEDSLQVLLRQSNLTVQFQF